VASKTYHTSNRRGTAMLPRLRRAQPPP